MKREECELKNQTYLVRGTMLVVTDKGISVTYRLGPSRTVTFDLEAFEPTEERSLAAVHRTCCINYLVGKFGLETASAVVAHLEATHGFDVWERYQLFPSADIDRYALTEEVHTWLNTQK